MGSRWVSLMLALGAISAVAGGGDRVARADDDALPALVELLAATDDMALRGDVLTGMYDALRGRRNVAMPAGWSALYPRLAESDSPTVREKGTALALIFGDPQAVRVLRGLAGNTQAEPVARQRAVQSLVEARIKGLPDDLLAWLDDAVLRGAAIRGLAAYDDSRTPPELLERYSRLNRDERQDAVSTLATRPAWAHSLLDAVEKGTIPRGDVSAFTVRQLHAYRDKDLDGRLKAVWGEIRPTAPQKAELIARYKEELAAAGETANPGQGRKVFQQLCVQCHRLFDAGGQIGPELTGSNRANLDYVLENVLDPSAAIPREFRLQTVVTTDGRLISGVIREQTDTTLVLQTLNERVILPKEDIEEMTQSPISMMPEGIFEKLTIAELRNLLAYLKSPTQVALPE